jgi:hypothetical protein
MWVPGNGCDQPSGAYSTTHSVAKSSCRGLSKFTQGFEVELCHGGIEALINNALGITSDGSRRRREEIE